MIAGANFRSDTHQMKLAYRRHGMNMAGIEYMIQMTEWETPAPKGMPFIHDCVSLGSVGSPCSQLTCRDAGRNL